MDLYDNLAGSGTFSLDAVAANAGATVPHAGSSGGADLTLTAFQVQQIGALIYNGFDGSSGPTNNASNQAKSAATQLAIWNVEYGPGNYLYSGGNVDLTGVSPSTDLAGLQTEYNLLMSQVTDGRLWLPCTDLRCHPLCAGQHRQPGLELRVGSCERQSDAPSCGTAAVCEWHGRTRVAQLAAQEAKNIDRHGLIKFEKTALGRSFLLGNR